MANHTHTPVDHVVRRKLGPNVLTSGQLDPSIVKQGGVEDQVAGRKIASRFRKINEAVLTDQGGLDFCTEARLQLIRRFSACCCLAELLEEKMLDGKSMRLDEHALLTNTMLRVAHAIGINRRSRNVTPTLRDYLDMAKVIDTDGSEEINNIEEVE